MTSANATPNATPTTIIERPPRRNRVAVAALALGTVALVVGLIAVAIGQSASRRENHRTAVESAQTKWDTERQTSEDCVAAAKSRAGTIETGHDGFDAQFRQIDSLIGLVDLLDSLIGQFPESPGRDKAFAKTAERRTQLETDRAQVADDLAAFDAIRRPLDPAKCPPPPDGPRPT